MIDPFVLDILVDPLDHGALFYAPGAGVLVNPRTKVAYEVRDGIAVLLADEAGPLDDAAVAEHLADPEGRWTGVGG